MSVSDTIPMETINKDEDQHVHENAEDEEDNGEKSEESSEAGPSIDRDSAYLIPEFPEDLPR